MNREEKVLGFICDGVYIPHTFAEIAVLLDVPDEELDALRGILRVLEERGDIVQTKKKRYISAKDAGYVRGKYSGTQKGFGFVGSDDGGGEVFIPASSSFGALDGDEVLVRITAKEADNRKREGEVAKVLEHANRKVVGRFERDRNFSFLIPDNPKISADIFIPKSKTMNAKNGHKVEAIITKWGDGKKNPEGEIVGILGFPSQAGVDVLSVMKQYDLEEEFPAEVRAEVANIKQSVDEEELAGRTDFRSKKVITIDGVDAKDLDDAVSIEKNDDEYILTVHIADVSHYVKEKTSIDKEAFKRGTSVYLADRVVPMLPRELSNGICSLNPNENRLTLSVTMNIDSKGSVKSHKIEKGVIRTVARMTYDDVSEILSGNDDVGKKYEYIKEEIFQMRELSRLLRKKREQKGSINFDFPEAKIILDEKGKPIDIKKMHPTEAHGIIEEFMLVCNQTVAQQFFWIEAPFIYRIHEKPSLEKLTAFNDFLQNAGFRIKGGEDVQPREFSDLLEKIHGTPAEGVIGRVMLRSLMKAKYSEENSGHFGLAFEHYCHFTSPIRRYPDLAIHRIIKEYEDNPPTGERLAQIREFAVATSAHSSQAEFSAQEAEREVDDLKKAQYMVAKIGEEMDGIISSVTSFGFFVELDNTVEGLVRLTSLKDDYYIYDEHTLSLTGERSGKIYKIGDAVRIRVDSVDTHLKEIDFVPVEA